MYTRGLGRHRRGLGETYDPNVEWKAALARGDCAYRYETYNGLPRNWPGVPPDCWFFSGGQSYLQRLAAVAPWTVPLWRADWAYYWRLSSEADPWNVIVAPNPALPAPVAVPVTAEQAAYTRELEALLDLINNVIPATLGQWQNALAIAGVANNSAIGVQVLQIMLDYSALIRVRYNALQATQKVSGTSIPVPPAFPSDLVPTAPPVQTLSPVAGDIPLPVAPPGSVVNVPPPGSGQEPTVQLPGSTEFVPVSSLPPSTFLPTGYPSNLPAGVVVTTDQGGEVHEVSPESVGMASAGMPGIGTIAVLAGLALLLVPGKRARTRSRR